MLHPTINASFMCPEIPGIAEATARESDDVVGTNVATCNSRFLCRCDCYHHASSSFTAAVVGRRLPSTSSRMFLQWCTSLVCVFCLFFFSRVFAAMTTNLFKKTATKTLCTNTKQSFYLQSAVMKGSGKGSKLIVQNAVMKFRKGNKRTFRDREAHQHLIIF
jgi:hypothetical protein